MTGDLFFDPDEPVFTEAGEVVKRRERRRRPTPYERALFDRCMALRLFPPPGGRAWGPGGSRWRAQQETATRGKMLAMLGAFATGQSVPPAFAEVARLDGEVARDCYLRSVPPQWATPVVVGHSITDGCSTDNWIAWLGAGSYALRVRQPASAGIYHAVATRGSTPWALINQAHEGQRVSLDVLRDHLEEQGVIIPPASAWRLR